MTERSELQANTRPAERVDLSIPIAQAETETEKTELTARWILEEFGAYYFQSRRIPQLAQDAFEKREPKTSLALSKKRLSMYSESISELAPRLNDVFPDLAETESLWENVETQYLPLIEGRYEADLAFAYIHSVRRKIFQDEWKPVEYSFSEGLATRADISPVVYRTFPGGARVSAQTIAEILKIPGFSTPYRALAEDAALVAERVNHDLAFDGRQPRRIEEIDIIDAGFYRNRGAYLVGRLVLDDASEVPLIIALLNEEHGIYVDAVLNSEKDTHNLFSSTLANFHVTNEHYHELAAFLHTIMPLRPLGLHYSTIGFNHVGKVAVMNELKSELAAKGEVFKTAIGFPGTVTIGFAAPSSSYNLKVIRDKPTSQYKWGKFQGLAAVLHKYKRVHEINRAGSMLDNIIYYNLKLDKAAFDPSLLEELLQQAEQSVSLEGGSVIFKHLIVQRRIIPLPVFLETASPDDATRAIANLGYSIKNNMAANICNKDLDARNYGVSRFLRVYLFDYDALEPLMEVRIRSNQDRIDGEEDPPDWYFEEGVVLLPEEIEGGLGITDRSLRKLFREMHADLLTTSYWEGIQDALREGKVPRLHVYPEERRLKQGVRRKHAISSA
ncbi:MAG: isocitrate dehydrogenase kinase/phosphatase AceK regulatory subunit [Acidiferrobacterales bacterium]